MKKDNGYKIFLVIELARLNGIISKDLEYDETWILGSKLYHLFSISKFNDITKGEYECIEKFIVNKTPTNPVQELLNRKETMIDAVVELLVNTVQAKNLFIKGSWKAVDAAIPDKRYFNPNFTIYLRQIFDKLDGLNIFRRGININHEIHNIVQKANQKLNARAFQVKPNGTSYSISIII